ncbi:MAG: cyclic pyranopterin monophosphate synthase MoaC [Firmicutes bacterium]|nr:cyclic pyranopterin monophosphate synthase MoaC [Bacillota bacterium]
MGQLTHFDREGRARMVDISGKKITKREAIASADIIMKTKTLKMIKERRMAKGDVLSVAKVAGIMAAKRTSELIPMCHPLKISNIEITFNLKGKNRIQIKSKVKCLGRTGVEMEALTAATVSALTIYDMCKAVDREMVISDVKLLIKTGGKSGTFIRKQ